MPTRRNKVGSREADVPRRLTREDFEIPLGVESLLSGGFGLRSMYHLHYAASPGEWRRGMRTLFESFEKAIRDTVVGDEQHKTNLIARCRRARERVRSGRNQVVVAKNAVEDLAWICCDLLGGARVQRGPRRGARTNWSLARHRTVFYASTAVQMASRILDHDILLEADKYKERFGEKVPSVRNLMREHRKRGASSFVAWFRDQYPKTYASLFWT